MYVLTGSVDLLLSKQLWKFVDFKCIVHRQLLCASMLNYMNSTCIGFEVKVQAFVWHLYQPEYQFFDE
jgi:hypothetical protein